ncbi:MAG: hypothetical protein WHS89_02455 [Acidimicrobiales bacterium]
MVGSWRSLWGFGKLLLVSSLVPLAVALGCFLVPVENPGVQRCGAPLVFALGGERNRRVERDGLDDPTFERRRTQAPCSQRVEGRLGVGFAAGGLFVVLATCGAVLGLIDDRLQLRRAASFEDVFRDWPDRGSVSRP